MKVISLFLFFFYFFSGITSTFSQTLSMEVVGSAGTYATSNGISMAWTIGEVTIETFSNENVFLTQGFHQPEKVEEVILSDFNIPEGFSPNLDDINDLFVIRGIDKYPNNSIVIFNRWGDEVFEASPYNNTWDGTTKMGLRVGGDQLPVGTYFYLFDFGNSNKIVKGTIYINM